METPRVDFSYAFGTPHRLTVALPDSSNKTILDAMPGQLRMAWSYDNLVRFPLSVYAMPKTEWDFTLKLGIDGKDVETSTWTRTDGCLPVLENVYNASKGSSRLRIAGAEHAAVTRVELENRDTKAHTFSLTCTSKESLCAGFNPAWLDEQEFADVLVAGWKERGDRVLFLSVGADEVAAPAAHVLQMKWTVKAKSVAKGWLVRPYEAYRADVPTLRKQNWKREFDAAVDAWKKLLGRSATMMIPDVGVSDGFRACLADLFIMREPVAKGYVAGIAGTENYRAANNAEPAVQAVCLDQCGYHAEAESGYQMCLDLQGDDGDWADPMAWSNHWWSSSGFKSFAVMEHYRITGDKKYLKRVYPKMLASSRFQERARAKTRKLVNGKKPLTYGLMPRGQGDCGLCDGEDYYGVYYPHNFWATFADRCAYEVAVVLKQPEAAELEKIYRTAWQDVLTSLERGAIQEDGYRWIPGAPGKTSGSRWGVLNALAPCGLLPADHELITGTIRKMESRMSPGGVPLHTGWQKDGMWVAMTLDNLAQALLVRGEVDRVGDYLYATLNHGTPLYTWCEERGQLPGDTNCTGDRQHLFTPIAVIRCIRDMLVVEEGNGLHLGRASHRAWLSSGEPIGVKNAPTHFGVIAWQMQYDRQAKKIVASIELPEKSSMSHVMMHVRLHESVAIRSVQARGVVATIDGNAIRIDKPKGKIKLSIEL